MAAPHPDRLSLIAAVDEEDRVQHVRGPPTSTGPGAVPTPPTAFPLSAMRPHGSANTGPPASKTASAPLPPDVAAVRKARMNADLISIFKRTCPPGAASSIKGIGLYTHIEGSATLSPDGQHSMKQPEFLPINNTHRSEELRDSISEDIKEVWEQLQRVVQQEEELIGKAEFGLPILKKRYGGFDAPDSSLPQHAHQAALRDLDTAMQEDIAGQDEAWTDARRPSLKSALANLDMGNRDVEMGGTEPEARKKSIGHAEFYREDPRMRR